LYLGLGAGVDREDDGFVQSLEGGEDFLKDTGRIGSVRPVDRFQQVTFGFQVEIRQQGESLKGHLGKVQHRIVHDIPDLVGAFLDPFPFQMVNSSLTGAKEEISAMVRKHAVVFLGHLAIE